jgi:hypothetical protein
MIGITLTTDQIRNAPAEVRRWIEHEVIASLGIAADAPPPAAAVNVFFEFGRPGISFGQPAVMSFRLIDILHHTRLSNIEQVMVCLDLINQALSQVRHDMSARFCGFDNEGHCLIAPATQASIASLWQTVVANQQPAASSAAA